MTDPEAAGFALPVAVAVEGGSPDDGDAPDEMNEGPEAEVLRTEDVDSAQRISDDEAAASGVDWPRALVQELAERRVVIVIGSGVSATASSRDGAHPPTWRALVEALSNSAVQSSDTRTTVIGLLETGRLPEAASVVRRHADAASFDLGLRESLLSPGFEASATHGDLASLDAKVVISLNFDKIYETLCSSLSHEQYIVVDYADGQLVNYIRSSRRVI